MRLAASSNRAQNRKTDHRPPSLLETTRLDVSCDTRNRRRSNKDKINGAIVYDRDFEYDYFGFKTLERSYLMRCDGDIAERPQHMIMRVAIGIHGSDVDAASSNRARIQQKEHWSLPLVETTSHDPLSSRHDRIFTRNRRRSTPRSRPTSSCRRSTSRTRRRRSSTRARRGPSSRPASCSR